MPLKSLSIKWDLEKGDRVRMPVQRRKQLWRAANRQYALEKRTAPNLAPSCLTFEVNSESCTLVLSLELACKPTGGAPAMRDSPMCRKHGIALQCAACNGARGSQKARLKVSKAQLSEWGKKGILARLKANHKSELNNGKVGARNAFAKPSDNRPERVL